MTSFWASNPELFLRTGKDGVVQLWRCYNYKEISSTTPSSSASLSSMLMRPEDFKQEGTPVTDHLSLFGGFYDWDEKKYKALIDFISPKHLLVNRLGSVIVELATDDKAAPLVYIRGLDVLAMGPFGPPTRPIPARVTVRYLQDGMVARTMPVPPQPKTPSTTDQPSPKETKLTEALTAKTKQLEIAQKQLEKETKEKRALAKRVGELENEAIKNSGSTYTTVRIYTKVDTEASLTILDGQLMLKPYIHEDDDFHQCWVKDDKYGESVKDASGFPSFALVNKFTGLAMKHSIADMKPVQLVPYNPFVVDESILWSEDELGDGYSAIRMANNISLNLQLNVFNGDINGAKQGAGVPINDNDGTSTVMLGKWLAGDNQKWKIVPYCK